MNATQLAHDEKEKEIPHNKAERDCIHILNINTFFYFVSSCCYLVYGET